uniref:Cytochrome c oxidase subunit 3 n=1 Tax=Glandirana rugosa TaxID=8410 RepID=A0A7G1HHY7_GLARU|nr:cytochrome c oxidase subunit III [Glandirana rugosa]
MAHQAHAFHMVNPSPWPLQEPPPLFYWHQALPHDSLNTLVILTAGLTLMLLTMIQWWRDIVREGTFQGHHTPPVQKGLRYGMILFITSEVFFFIGFFWAFYNASLAPTPEVGECWPPTGITPFNPFEIPLLNTAVLLASGVSVTWAHHSIMQADRKGALQALTITVTLGLYFTLLQAMEYYEAPFTIADGIYGTTFFVATGFHGLHVIIGSIFLVTCLLRQFFFHSPPNTILASKPLHDTDTLGVVWLFLYVSIYWWGS